MGPEGQFSRFSHNVLSKFNKYLLWLPRGTEVKFLIGQLGKTPLDRVSVACKESHYS